MANKNEQETRNSIDELNDSLTSATAKVEANKKIIVAAVISIIAIGAAVLIYLNLFREPAIAKSNDAIGKADNEQIILNNDSTALAQYMMVADELGYDAGNRAALMSAINLYKEGKYEDAIKYIDNFDGKGSIVEANAYSLKGDCYVNLKKYPEAIDCYDDAISASDENTYLAPFFMIKKAKVLNALQKYAEEAVVYETIQKDYPQFISTYLTPQGLSIQSYIERANAQAGK